MAVWPPDGGSIRLRIKGSTKTDIRDSVTECIANYWTGPGFMLEPIQNSDKDEIIGFLLGASNATNSN